MPTVVLATRNTGKIKELSSLLEAFGITVQGLDAHPEIGDIPETGETFEENSRIKAEAVSLATGLTALADDSGLAVDFLDGAPGVYSARYSEEPGNPATPARNNEKLLAALAGVPWEQRRARFRCVVVAAAPNGAELTADASWEGYVAEELRGGGGFGYDPLFFDPELGKHAAELDRRDKNARSHRGKALKELLAHWPEFWARARA